MKNNEISAAIRNELFNEMGVEDLGWEKVSGTAYAKVVTDVNGNDRYVKMSITVAPIREDGDDPTDKLASDKGAYESARKAAADREARAAKKRELAAQMKAAIAAMNDKE